MAIKGRIREYFAEGLTARGYISLLPNLAEGLRRVYYLLGGPAGGKSDIISTIGVAVAEQGYDLDLVRSAKETDSFVGLVIPAREIAVIDAYEVSPLRWKAPGIVEAFIDLTQAYDLPEGSIREEILEVQRRLSTLQMVLEDELAESFGEPVKGICFDLQGKGGTWMTHSAARLNWGREKSGPWSKAQAVLDKLQRSVVTPYFLHGLSAHGWLNLAPGFLNGFDRIELEGEETLDVLNWVLQEAQFLGQLIEIVLHPLRPEEVIGVVFPQRHLALWQGDAGNLAHQGLPEQFGDSLHEVLSEIQKQRAALKQLYQQISNPARLQKALESLHTAILQELE